jgi:hypothetical protein
MLYPASLVFQLLLLGHSCCKYYTDKFHQTAINDTQHVTCRQRNRRTVNHNRLIRKDFSFPPPKKKKLLHVSAYVQSTGIFTLYDLTLQVHMVQAYLQPNLLSTLRFERSDDTYGGRGGFVRLCQCPKLLLRLNVCQAQR